LKEVKKCADFVGLFYENRILYDTQFSPTSGVTIPLWFHVHLYPDMSYSFRTMGRWMFLLYTAG